jgi:stage II sporulation protein E
MSQNRAITLEYLRLIERMTADTARRRSLQVCSAETQALRMILRRCGCEYTACIVHRLRSGRYAAEVYTKSDEIPLAAVQELLGRHLGVSLRSTPLQKNTSGSRFCVYETPPYYLEYAIKSVNAPDYERCGDHADAFTDAVGNQYLVLSDGMGSGSSASLASKITVRTFCSLVSCDMPEETAIQLINSMLLTETNTENFATLDVLKLCADSGELVLYKSGAAPTLFRHMGCVRCISDQSFPVGIVPRTEPSRRKMTAYAYDQIVMLSDGVCEEQYPLIKELLAQELTPEAAAESLCAKAASSQNTVCRDDMTVIIAKICTKAEKTVSKMQKAPTATAVTV